ncbi:hypothetical protein HRG_003966 [Hirsutella rhossiliensis]|uniref:DUF5672 domain-containing protein n=1 Tax=Hirsutella rhossiliensis TaxID=111463 RepID=A0A9P8N333_9HYPO|nr:uncharacterized protein HRG_03966 [Hirsutella rhossiliensis]KAH0965950.1 hypothetical protein HRG_03966 [Hirsutella rhossiliensis]
MPKARLLLLASLVLTWWLAHLASRYRPMVQAELSIRVQEARRRIPSLLLGWRPVGDGRIQYNTSKVALLIEPRPLPHLVPLITHMASVVPPDWRFLFIGSPWSVYNVGRSPAIKHQQAVGKMTVMKMPKPWSMDGKEDMSRLLTDARFYDEFLPGVEWLFKYEHDSILCANSPKDLDEWLSWSWAGAPRSEDDRLSSTGGLTLRRVSAIRRVLAFQSRHNNSEPEDEWFAKRLSAMPGEKVASRLHGAFAVQIVHVERPMGYHVPDGGANLDTNMWKDPEMRRKIFDYCPELSMIMDMKLERERCPDDDRHGGRKPVEEYFATKAVHAGTEQQDAESARNRLIVPPRLLPAPQPRLEA